MLRGGGVCVEGPPGSLPRVSPRIRALQDRLLDSLPADGAWECLSPAQREAIISLHRTRLTRNIVSQGDSSDVAKQQNRKNNKGITKGLHRYGRSRSYEDKLESETDDSGVRVASGGTNSSSTSNSHNSHEDDSSDPGVKRGGRFAKSPNANRLTRKEQKCSLDVNKQKGITNGVGNVNKIISKQLHRSGQQCTSNVTLDFRNIPGDKRRPVIDRNGVFDTRQQQFDIKYQHYSGEKVVTKHEGISRKNILQRYQDSGPLITKESTSSEECDSGINFRIDKKEISFSESSKPRRPNSGVDYDFEFESDQTPRSDSTPSPCGPNRKEVRLNGDPHRGIVSDKLWEHNHIVSKNKKISSVENKNISDADNKRINLRADHGSKLNSRFDYRTQINQEGINNKYSNNWNSIILSRALPIKTHNIPSAKASPLNNPLFKTSTAQHGRSVGNLVYEERHANKGDFKLRNEHSNFEFSAYQEKGQGKKYIRSKSLDRKHLDDTSDDDESDFEIRRRTDRMRRYAKANQEWEVYSKQFVDKNSQFVKRNVYVPNEGSKPKSKSSWDISRKTDNIENDNIETNCFRSRSNILNKWKSEENELTKNAGNLEKRDVAKRDFDKYKWRRRSCDFELDVSDNDTRRKRAVTSPADEFTRKQWQRRSCDFELEVEDDESVKRKKLYDDDWDDSVGNEIKILQQRNQLSPKAELRRIYPVSSPKEKNDNRRCLIQDEAVIEECILREKLLLDHTKKYQIRPEISGRKWARIEDEHRAIPSHVYVNKQEKGKGKTPHAFRGKLRLFKSILPF